MKKQMFPASPIARSCLQPLTPAGLGTAMVESMESYVLRLARDHRVTRFHIERIVSEAGAEPLFRGTSRQPFRIDSPFESAKEFAGRLARLTGTPPVASLGLGWLAGKVATTGALRDHRAWCPQCIGERKAVGQPPHLPLLWSLPSYELCIVHGGSMQSACPSCSKRISVRREWAWPFDACPHCTVSLARPASAIGHSFRDLERRKVRGVDQRAARYLGELISTAHELQGLSILDTPDLPRLVSSAIARGRANHPSHLAAMAGIAKSTLHGLAVKRSFKPSLDNLARLSVAADVSLAGTLCPALWKEAPAGESDRTFLPVSSRRERPRISWDAVRRAANAQLRASSPESPGALARRLEVDSTQLKNTFPETIRKLSALHKQHKVRAQEAVRAKLEEQMRKHIDECSRSGRRASLRTTASALKVYRANQDVRASWKRCRAKE